MAIRRTYKPSGGRIWRAGAMGLHVAGGFGGEKKKTPKLSRHSLPASSRMAAVRSLFTLPATPDGVMA
jgi:hypothetical protein